MQISRRNIKRWLMSQEGRYCIIIFLGIAILKITGKGYLGEYFLPYDTELFANLNGSIFDGFDNKLGTKNGSNIVPNYVHFLFFGGHISYVQAVCVLAAFKNQRPEKIFFHTDVKEFSGPHWKKIKNTLGSTLEIKSVTLPTEIFGQKFGSYYHVYHASDVTRIRILMQYGGIFLDNDSYIIRSLEPFFKYEMTVGITDGNFMGTQVLITHKDARFLKLWLKSYKDYRPDRFYYNAGQKPMKEILFYKPELVHLVPTLLGVHSLADRLYVWDKWDWRKFYSVHLVIRHRHYMINIRKYMDFIRWINIDESNICDYPKPFGEMARDVYSDFCPK